MVIMDSDIKMTRLMMMVMMMILTVMMLMMMVMLMMAIMVMTMLSKLLITHCFRQDHMNELTISPLCLTQRGVPSSIPRYDLKSFFRLLSLPCSFKFLTSGRIKVASHAGFLRELGVKL